MKSKDYGVSEFLCMVCGFRKQYLNDDEVLEVCPECGLEIKKTVKLKGVKKWVN